jgi:hypothetical protein
MSIVIGVAGQSDLLEIIRAPDSIGRLAHLLHGGKEQAD